MTPSSLLPSTVTIVPVLPGVGELLTTAAAGGAGMPGLLPLAKGVGEAAGEGGDKSWRPVPWSGLSLPSPATTRPSGKQCAHLLLSRRQVPGRGLASDSEAVEGWHMAAATSQSPLLVNRSARKH